MADFILNMPPHFFARVFGNPVGDPVLLKSRGVTLLRDRFGVSLSSLKPGKECPHDLETKIDNCSVLTEQP